MLLFMSNPITQIIFINMKPMFAVFKQDMKSTIEIGKKWNGWQVVTHLLRKEYSNSNSGFIL